MIEQILTQASSHSSEHDLRLLTSDFVDSLRRSAGRGDSRMVARAESEVRSNPEGAFAFDPAGVATLTAAGGSWAAGRFETPSIAELRQRAVAARAPSGGAVARLWVLDGASPATDIGALQATAGGRALFQVASQFNCLESPGPYVSRVADYFSDPTQGPRASISSFPATLLRHYRAPGSAGGRFVQHSGGPQIDLLADVFDADHSPVRDGYFLGRSGRGASSLVANLESGFERIRLGVHERVQVVLGYNWDGAVEDSADRRITQVFTSTVAGGGYGGSSALGEEFEPACRLTLRAAYLGTLLAAISLERTPVVLTLIGGGVFRNPVQIIWDAILWAFDEVQPLVASPLDVVLNGYNLSRLLQLEDVLPDVGRRGGAILRFDSAGLIGIYR